MIFSLAALDCPNVNKRITYDDIMFIWGPVGA